MALKVTQIARGHRTKPSPARTLRARWRRGIGKSNVLPDRPEIHGMTRSRAAPDQVEEVKE